MKKLNCLLLGAMLACIGMTPVHAQTKIPQVKENIMHKLVEQSKYYMFDRIKTMCSEWPGCEKWALERRKENPSFVIIDAEIEYYVGDNSMWNYNLYVETMEDLQTKTYVFVSKERKFYTKPSELKFKKFPGHPFTDMPSEHAKYEHESWDYYGEFPPKNSKLCKRWPAILDVVWEVASYAVEQQRVIWDTNGNPRWERRVDITQRGEGAHDVAVIARQQKSGAPFKYISARKTFSILKAAHYRAEFSFTTKY